MTSPTIIAAWQVVQKAAVAFSKSTTGDTEANRALHEAVLAYAATRQPAKPDKRATGIVLKFGRSKGKTIEDAATADLQWMVSALGENIEDPDKARWRQQNVELRDAIETELASR